MNRGFFLFFLISTIIHLAVCLILWNWSDTEKPKGSSSLMPLFTFLSIQNSPKSPILSPKKHASRTQNSKSTMPTKSSKAHSSPPSTTIVLGQDLLTTALSSNVPPEYPRFSRIHKEEGEVQIEVKLKKNSNYVLSTRVFKSSGHPTLDQSALSAVQKWNFNFLPLPHSEIIIIPINFTLRKK